MSYKFEDQERRFFRDSNVPPLDASDINLAKLLFLANIIFEALDCHSHSASELPLSTEYDVFISHCATEDDFVDALAKHLTRLGLKECYDSLSFKNGDFLLSSMDKGIEKSRLCIAILSPGYIGSYWCCCELNAILQLEKSRDSILLFPVWHHVQYAEVLKFSPIIASRKALSTDKYSAAEIAIEVQHYLAA